MKLFTDDDFERRVAEIAALIEESGATVTWNARIPDPDNPTQNRQIDVLIDRDGTIVHVECRNWEAPQQVGWIEELAGRRQSLRIDSIYAASSSGFTRGAIKKARRLGVHLRDLRTLSDEEVQRWGVKTRVFLGYLRFDGLRFFLVVEPRAIRHVAIKGHPFRTSDGRPWPFDKAILPVASYLANGRDEEGGVARVELFPKDLYFGAVPISEMWAECEWTRVEVERDLPVVTCYGDPEVEYREAILTEMSRDSAARVAHSPDGGYLLMDMAMVEPIPKAVFRYFQLDLGEPQPMKGAGVLFARIHEEIPFKVHTVPKESAEYASLTDPSSIRDSVVIEPEEWSPGPEYAGGSPKPQDNRAEEER